MSEFASAQASGALVAAPATLRVVHASIQGADSKVELHDGGAGGPTRLEIFGPVDQTFALGDGISFTTDVHAVLTGNGAVHVVYDGPPAAGAAPTVAGCTPQGGARGHPPFEVTVTGTNFQFGATVDFGGNGVSVLGLPAVSADGTSLVARVRIAKDATAGARNVAVTNPDGSTGTGNNLFTVGP